MHLAVTLFSLGFCTLTARNSMASELSAFGPGEQTTYRITYLGLKAGSAQITVGTQTTYEGHDVWPIVALAQSESIAALYPIKDKFITYWAHSLQRSVGSELLVDENRKRRRQRIQVSGTTATVTKQKAGEPEETLTFEVDPQATDMAAVTFALRNLPLQVGESIDLPIFTGARSFTLRAHAEGRETLSTSKGPQDALKIRLQTQFTGKLAAKRDVLAWLSADDLRLPLKIEADLALGSIVVELVDYKPGRRVAMLQASPAQEASWGGANSNTR